MKEICFLSGLPRSGSTILANITNMHPGIYATPSSPLCNIVQSMRKTWSDDSFLKSQLDNDFPLVNERLKRTTIATMKSWSDEGKGNITLDKSRGWLFCIEWLKNIIPNFKMIVTLRDLRNIYASIEKQHRNTMLLNFPDHLEHNIVDFRANSLFENNGLVGGCLTAISNIGDVPDIINNLMFWRYEDFLSNPEETIDKTFQFLNVKSIKIDFENIMQNTCESDSHYNMKYLHKIHSKIQKPIEFKNSKISPRIIETIVNKNKWYYEIYYPEIFQLIKQKKETEKTEEIEEIEEIEIPNNRNEDGEMIFNIEKAIEEETKSFH